MLQNIPIKVTDRGAVVVITDEILKTFQNVKIILPNDGLCELNTQESPKFIRLSAEQMPSAPVLQ